MDDESLMMIRAHGFIHLDGKSHRAVGDAILIDYPGKKRVCMLLVGYLLHLVSEALASPFLPSKDVARLWLRRIASSIRGLTPPLYSQNSTPTVPQNACLHLSVPRHKHPAPTRRKFPSVLPSYNWSRTRKITTLVFKGFFKFAVKRPSRSDQGGGTTLTHRAIPGKIRQTTWIHPGMPLQSDRNSA
ncbi:hypothetical protein [Halocynthiibacter styelae]|uniref:Uncharacterized protein n=1 Tax=Halocynthiibacter styelae TaxID=2761955 RepID=A0A8J7IC32_9RHOB|nr:hypothetical protein [Paenihalocynthiibacter styelae]MBI1492853.1 hypothetical protein [Paenihalocynthiibacter styelae]